jgi:hypothetical protein
MYLHFEQVVANDTVQTVAALNPPGNATHAEIQADSNPVRYTMDDATDPAVGSGMIFVANEVPKTFVIDDVRRIRFIRGAGANGNLNIHYFAGRDV